MIKNQILPMKIKSLNDAKALIPVLKDCFAKHPLIRPNIFLGDAAFDSVGIYSSLFNEIKFNKAYIPLNHRSGLENADYFINEQGIPCCPQDPSLPLKPESTSRLRSGVQRFKFVCPKVKWKPDETGKHKRSCYCENPCTKSSCGRMVYVYPEKNLRAYPRTVRGTAEWDETYKIRSVVEKSINHLKDSFCVAGRKTQNEKTIHADLLLAGITQLITVVLSDKVHMHQYIRSLKPLLA